jgi:probable HAF family extracellular repeat protein
MRNISIRLSAAALLIFIWPAFGAAPGFQGLGDLPGASFYSGAQGISADGSVVVGRSYSASGEEAFLWNAVNGMVGLGDLPGGLFYSRAYGVSADGSVVVGWGNSSSGQEAFYWTADSGMQSLKDILENSGLDLTGWTLGVANGLSADGLTVVGYGTNPQGNEEAWIATIPEPATICLFGIAGLFLRRKK